MCNAGRELNLIRAHLKALSTDQCPWVGIQDDLLVTASRCFDLFSAIIAQSLR